MALWTKRAIFSNAGTEKDSVVTGESPASRGDERDQPGQDCRHECCLKEARPRRSRRLRSVRRCPVLERGAASDVVSSPAHISDSGIATANLVG